MRIVLDTNCLLVIVAKTSPYRWIYDKILLGEIEIVLTTEILSEYAEILERFYSPKFSEYILKALLNLPNTIRVNPISFNWLLIYEDPDDNKFVDAYISSNADLILTNDRHFEILQKIKFPPVNCLKIQEFQFQNP